MKYIKKFNSLNDANGFVINDIPFICSADNKLARCNEDGKKIEIEGGNIEIVDIYDIHNNQIWYTTVNDEPYPLEQIIVGLQQMSGTYNGPAIISNEYDEDLDMYVMEFENNVTVLGDINFNEKTADGPFFATYQEFGIACNVETIILPKTVNRIGDLAFFGCSSLTSVTIPNSVTTIGESAFEECSGLASVTIPNSVTSIGDYAFARTGLTSVTIPNSVISIGYSAFYHCSSLTSITIPNDVTRIAGETFGDCTGLTFITIPNSVISIEEWAFVSCTSLTSITIPNNVTNIGHDAFNGCTGLTSVTCEATTPPTCDTAVFYDTNDCPIYVPAQSVNAYKAAENWSTYADRIQAIQ